MNIKPYTPLSEKYKPLVESRIQTVASSPFRPHYHIAPPCGLLNDPNGLCYLNGKYHVFYQWYPFEAKHDMKHWNHVSSEDLIHWEEEADILIPDLAYEKNGCYSGNAYVDPETQTAYLYYTANYKDENGVRIPQQALAVMDKNGHIVKSEKNPLINEAPESVSENIRDPFVFSYKGKLYMLLGAESQSHEGCLLLYKAADYENWEYQGILDIEFNGQSIDLGTMVECPGIILGDKDILFLSLIGSKQEGIGHENRFDTIALIGNLDLDKRIFNAERIQTLDYGFDFYAPQPFLDKNGKPVFYGWFGSANEELPEDKYHWRHALTLPREMIIEEDRLKTPVYPKIKDQFNPVEIHGQENEWIVSSSEPTLLKWNLKNDNKRHSLKVGSQDDYWELILDFGANTLQVDRSSLKIPVDPEYGMIRSLPLEEGKDAELEIYLDNSFNEIYLNNGEKVLSFRSYENTLNNSKN